jgi:hypothetical protein
MVLLRGVLCRVGAGCTMVVEDGRVLACYPRTINAPTASPAAPRVTIILLSPFPECHTATKHAH